VAPSPPASTTVSVLFPAGITVSVPAVTASTAVPDTTGSVTGPAGSARRGAGTPSPTILGSAAARSAETGSAYPTGTPDRTGTGAVCAGTGEPAGAAECVRDGEGDGDGACVRDGLGDGDAACVRDGAGDGDTGSDRDGLGDGDTGSDRDGAGDGDDDALRV
jgi:hypothetical protein